jgi:hypothetical protein
LVRFPYWRIVKANTDASRTPENEAELLIARTAKTIVAGWVLDGLGAERRQEAK